MVILGLNAYHGDASAALVIDGQLIAAAEEERFNRIKHSAGFPTQAIQFCLKYAGITPSDIDAIAVARDPRARLFTKALYALRMPRFALSRLGVQAKFIGIRESLGHAFDLAVNEIRTNIYRVEHHQAHLASSFFVSPFEEAALLSVDGLGDFASTMWGIGRGASMKIEGSIAFPHSLGMFYTALTQYLGFWSYGDEYKVMGLASYGEPEFREHFRNIVRLNDTLGFSLGLPYFIHHKTGPDMSWNDGEPVQGCLFSSKLEQTLGPTRSPESAIGPYHENIAATMQAALEDVMFHMLNKIHERTGLKKLCLAGGVAFNCVANGQIFDRTPFEDVYVQSAAGDAGLAIGAAYHVWHQTMGNLRTFEMAHSYWGPEYGDEDIQRCLDQKGLRYAVFDHPEQLYRAVAKTIAGGNVTGWFQGRMEWGPRALGNRSILADPRRSEMKDILNARIKRREPFRPFAPSILEERVGEYFEETHPSPFMLMAYKVKPEKREKIPAPTHVDGTGRLQTVSRAANQSYWALIRAFEQETGVPVLLNTSFNENEPVVCTPAEAIACFIRTKMDALAIGRYLVIKDIKETLDKL